MSFLIMFFNAENDQYFFNNRGSRVRIYSKKIDKIDVYEELSKIYPLTRTTWIEAPMQLWAELD